MTFAELRRLMESKRRVEKLRLQEKATFDYTLADLIGRSVSRIHSSANKMPEISEVYPTLFDAKEVEERKSQQKTKLSAARFRQFTSAFNKRFEKGGIEEK